LNTILLPTVNAFDGGGGGPGGGGGGTGVSATAGGLHVSGDSLMNLRLSTNAAES
jgi:hypothetical protein